jgi:hypothetical protein
MNGHVVGNYGEALVQYELTKLGYTVDPIGSTAQSIDLLAWKEGVPGMGISVKASTIDRSSLLLFKNQKAIDAMRRECSLRGVEPYICAVGLTESGNHRIYLLPMDLALKYETERPTKSASTAETIGFYRTAKDETLYDADSRIIKFHNGARP